MSAYTTKEITREEAMELYRKIYEKHAPQILLSSSELEKLLNHYAYKGEDEDILGVLFNFLVN